MELRQPMHVLKVRQQTKAERQVLKMIKKKVKMNESELITKIINLGFKHNEAKQAITYLINGFEIQRNGENLELITWTD